MRLRSRQIKAVSLICCLTFFSQISVAYAAPRIGISSFAAADLEPGQKLQFVNKVSSDFQTSTRVPVVRDTSLQSELTEAANRDKKEEGDLQLAGKLLKEGKAAYLQLDLPEARIKLESARKNFILNLHRLNNNNELLQSHLYLGMVYVAQGVQNLAVEEFRKVAFLDPDLELSTKEYSPDTVSAFSKAKNSIDREVLGAVLVDSQPDKSKLYINARPFGETPVNINLPVGEYFFRLAKPGHRDWYQVIKVEEGFQKLSKSLPAAISGEEEKSTIYRVVSRDYPATTRIIEQLSEKAIDLQVDVLLLGEINRGKEYSCTAQWYDARTQEFSPVVTIKGRNDFPSLLNRSPALVKGLLDLIGSNGYIMADKGLTPKAAASGPPRNDSMLLTQPGSPMPALTANNETPAKKVVRPWYKKWWVWGIIVGGAAAVGTSLYFANQSGTTSITVDNGGNVPNPIVP